MQYRPTKCSQLAHNYLYVLLYKVSQTKYYSTAGNCPNGWIPVGTSCYVVNLTVTAPSQAVDKCNALYNGAELAIFERDPEKNEVYDALR